MGQVRARPTHKPQPMIVYRRESALQLSMGFFGPDVIQALIEFVQTLDEPLDEREFFFGCDSRIRETVLYFQSWSKAGNRPPVEGTCRGSVIHVEPIQAAKPQSA